MEPADLLYLHGKDPLKPDTNTYIITGDSGQVGGRAGGRPAWGPCVGQRGQQACMAGGRHNKWDPRGI